MLPLTTVCVRGKNSSSTLLNCCQHITYWNSLVNATSCHYKSEAKIAPAQFLSSAVKAIVNALGNTLSGHDMCPRQKWLQRNIVVAAETLPDSGALESASRSSPAFCGAITGNSGDQRAPKIMCEQSAVPFSSDMFMVSPTLSDNFAHEVAALRQESHRSSQRLAVRESLTPNMHK